MRYSIAIAAVASMLCTPAKAELVLNAGDRWTYEFTSLLHVVLGLGEADPVSGFNFGMPDYQVGTDLLRVAMYENSLSDPPLCEYLNDTEPAGDSCSAVGAWSDFQGVASLEMLAGSARLDYVIFYNQIPNAGGDGWTRYELHVFPTSLPEPSTLFLAAFGAMGLLIAARRKR